MEGFTEEEVGFSESDMGEGFSEEEVGFSEADLGEPSQLIPTSLKVESR